MVRLLSVLDKASASELLWVSRRVLCRPGLGELLQVSGDRGHEDRRLPPHNRHTVPEAPWMASSISELSFGAWFALTWVERERSKRKPS